METPPSCSATTSAEYHKSKEPDRLSSLPDELILHILSFLSAPEAIITCFLSRRWKNLWSRTPCLNFSDRDRCGFGYGSFTSFVDKTLLLRSCPKLRRFCVCFEYQPRFRSAVDVWLRVAAESSVEELLLEFYQRRQKWFHSAKPVPLPYDMETNYQLPQQLYANFCLTELSLRKCDLEPRGRINWSSLRSLSMANLELQDGVMRKILDGCPLIEFLKLSDFCVFESFEIRNASLKELLLSECRHCGLKAGEDTVIRISAPNLRSLVIAGDMGRLLFRAICLQELEVCCLNFKQYVYDEELQKELLIELLQSGRCAKALTLGTHFFQYLDGMKVNPKHKILELMVDTNINSSDVPKIASLLHNLSNLEKLIIIINRPFNFEYYADERNADGSLSYNDGDYEPSSKRITFKSFLHLKTIKLIVLPPLETRFSKRMMTSVFDILFPLVKFLLKKAKVLEELVINSEVVDHAHLMRCRTAKEMVKMLYVKPGAKEKSNSFLSLLDVSQSLLSFPISSLSGLGHFVRGIIYL